MHTPPLLSPLPSWFLNGVLKIKYDIHLSIYLSIYTTTTTTTTSTTTTTTTCARLILQMRMMINWKYQIKAVISCEGV